MGAWLVRRIGAAVLSAWLVLTLAFFALRWLPGDAPIRRTSHAPIVRPR